MAVSYWGIASADRRCTRSTWPFAKCASALRGDAAKACPANSSASDIGSGRICHLIQHAGRERDRQQALSLDGPPVDCQRALEEANGFRIIVMVRRIRRYGPSA
jgi:hypothetical protein